MSMLGNRLWEVLTRIVHLCSRFLVRSISLKAVGGYFFDREDSYGQLFPLRKLFFVC